MPALKTAHAFVSIFQVRRNVQRWWAMRQENMCHVASSLCNFATCR